MPGNGFSRSKLTYAALLPFTMVVYVAIASLNKTEVFPFFNWSLFSNIPKWGTNEFVQVHTIDGQAPSTRKSYLGAFNHREKTNFQKTLRSLQRQCEALQDDEACFSRAREMILPSVIKFTGASNVTFSLIYCNIEFQTVYDKFETVTDKMPLFTEKDCAPGQTEILGPWTAEVEL